MKDQETGTARSAKGERGTKGEGTKGEQGSKVNPLVELHQAHQQAHLNWVREVQQAIAESQANAQKIQAEFAQNLQEQWRTATDVNQYAEAFRNNLKKVQESSSSGDLQNRLLEAHRNYLRTVREAWTQLDPDSITVG